MISGGDGKKITPGVLGLFCLLVFFSLCSVRDDTKFLYSVLVMHIFSRVSFYIVFHCARSWKRSLPDRCCTVSSLVVYSTILQVGAILDNVCVHC